MGAIATKFRVRAFSENVSTSVAISEDSADAGFFLAGVKVGNVPVFSGGFVPGEWYGSSVSVGVALGGANVPNGTEGEFNVLGGDQVEADTFKFYSLATGAIHLQLLDEDGVVIGELVYGNANVGDLIQMALAAPGPSDVYDWTIEDFLIESAVDSIDGHVPDTTVGGQAWIDLEYPDARWDMPGDGTAVATEDSGLGEFRAGMRIFIPPSNKVRISVLHSAGPNVGALEGLGFSISSATDTYSDSPGTLGPHGDDMAETVQTGAFDGEGVVTVSITGVGNNGGDAGHIVRHIIIQGNYIPVVTGEFWTSLQGATETP
ncbi:MAG TPA: hypothetical protein VFF19_22615 [Reyranella sp.]|nr:hypothetical protein [Reyranella sp.]